MYEVTVTNSDGTSRTFHYESETEAETERRAFLLAGLEVSMVGDSDASIREAINQANTRAAADRDALRAAAVVAADIARRYDNSGNRRLGRIVTRANRVSDAVSALLTELGGA